MRKFNQLRKLTYQTRKGDSVKRHERTKHIRVRIVFFLLLACLSILLGFGGMVVAQDIEIARDPQSGLIRFARPTAPLATGISRQQIQIDPLDAVRKILAQCEEILGLEGFSDSMRFVSMEEDPLGMIHVHLQQFLRNIPVYGAQMKLHLSKGAQELNALNGLWVPNLMVPTEPTIGKEEALSVVRGLEPSGDLWGEPELVIYTPYVDREVRENHLVWLVRIADTTKPSRTLYVIDALSGTVLTRYNEIHTGLYREIYDANNTSSLPGKLVRKEGDAPTGEPDADNAYAFLGDTYNFFKNNFRRDSYDNNGAKLLATVHYKQDYANAFWNGTQMVFGDGFVVDDVTAHELTHAVTDFTAALIYKNESGALSESMSDVFGEFVDLTNEPTDPAEDRWLMGEDLPIGAIRSMSNPPLYNQPDLTSNYVCTLQDNGGVHINSGIPNKAAYLMTDGGNFNGFQVTGIGLSLAAQVHYRTLAQYLVSSSGFVEYYQAMKQACADLYGPPSGPIHPCSQVDAALRAVEMDKAPECGGWAAFYAYLPQGSSDLNLLRTFRDKILLSVESGRVYTRLLYESSELALEVIKKDPGLLRAAVDLLKQHREVLKARLSGQENIPVDPKALYDFIEEFSREAPTPLKFLANEVIKDMRRSTEDGTSFLGFVLISGPNSNIHALRN